MEENFKAFRHGESEFYDMYRRLLDRPSSFGDRFEKQFAKYAADTETLRRNVRNAETNNLAMLDDGKQTLKDGTLP
ncbi:MAG: hypothetical protein O2820_01760 [Planctomycetota bacterium]|nr:hypothetical protein [Planctomycetota bacterium]MDA1247923.1 hypothetical protein [Planctomycetota bacterium]